MAKLWDDVRKSLKDFSSAAMEKAEEFGKVASDKAEELTKVGKITWEIKQLKRTRERQFLELGQLTFDLANKNELGTLGKNDSAKQYVNEIKTLTAEIGIKQARIDAIHAEFGMPVEGFVEEADIHSASEGGTVENAETKISDDDSDKSDSTDAKKK